MKKLTGIFAFTCLLGLGSAGAQVRKDIDRGATNVGHKTEQVASQSKSAIVDRRYKNKWGPHGEKVYIDHRSKYYYVNKTGRKVYVSRAQLRNKRYR